MIPSVFFSLPDQLKHEEEGKAKLFIPLQTHVTTATMAESEHCRKWRRKIVAIESPRKTDNYTFSGGSRILERGKNFPKLQSNGERFASNCRHRMNFKDLFLLLFVFFNLLAEVGAKIFSTQLGPSIVETQYGKLRGMLVTLSNKNLDQVEAYLGLQYAATLGSEMRFMPPSTTTEKWENIRPALQHRPVCPQVVPSLAQLRANMPTERVEHFRRILPFLEKQSEECLYLNVYVPVRDKLFASSATSQPQQQLPLLPVVVFIHGDSYEMGTGNAYDGSSMAVSGQHIVVTINFRVGVLGFLSTGDSSAQGNYALMDQAAALMWVRKNIESFGGDPNQVTLLGQGCGAAMVNMLTISPMVRGKGLFSKIILQSGTALAPWAFVKDPLTVTRRLAEKLNCLKNRVNDFPESAAKVDISSQIHPIVMQCLRQIPYEGLLSAAASLTTPRFHFLFGPVVDGEVIPPSQGLPVNLNIYAHALETTPSSEKFTVPASEADQNFSIMVGFTLGEGQAFFNQTLWDDGLSQEAMWRIVRTFIHNSFQFHKQTILDILLHQYRNWESSGLTLSRSEVRNSLYELLGDAMYASPTMKLASVASEYWTTLRRVEHTRKEFSEEDGELSNLFNEAKFIDHYSFKASRNHRKDSKAIGYPVKVYVYCYNRGAKEHASHFGNSSQTASQSGRNENSWPRSSHGDDLAYAFAAPITDGIDPFVSTYSWQDKNFNEAMLKLWGNFIRTGSPNDSPGSTTKKLKGNRFIPSLDVVYWPAYNTSGQQILLLESQKFSVKSFYRASKMALWLDLLPNIHKTSHHLDQCSFHQLDHSDNSSLFDGNLVSEVCSPSKPLSASSPKRAHLNNLVPNLNSNRKSSARNQSMFSSPPQQSKHTMYQKVTSPGLFSSFQFKEHNRHYQETEQDGYDSFPYNRHDMYDDSFDGSTSKTVVRPMQLSNQHQNHNLPLVVVIGVGCVLLSGNIFLFIAVYCQKKRRGRRKNFSCRSIHLSDNETGDQYYHKQHHQQTPMYSADHYRKDSKQHKMLNSSINQNNLNNAFKQQRGEPYSCSVSPYDTSKENSACGKSSKRMEFLDKNEIHPSRLHDRGRIEFSTMASQKGVKFVEPDADNDASYLKQHSNLHLVSDLESNFIGHGKAPHCYNNSTIVLEQLSSTSIPRSKHPDSASAVTTFSTLANQMPSMSETLFISDSKTSKQACRNCKVSETAIDCDILNETLSGLSSNQNTVSVSETSSVYSCYPTPTKPLVSFGDSPVTARRDADV